MASKNPIKTILWIDRSQVRRVLMTDVFRNAGLEGFFFSELEELSPEVLASLAPTLIVIHFDFESELSSPNFEKYQKEIIVLGKEIGDYHCLDLPIGPLKIVEQITEIFNYK